MFKKLIFLFILLFVLLEILAQPGLPNGAPACWPPPCVPIDGGISIFTFLSVLFGYKLISKNK